MQHTAPDTRQSILDAAYALFYREGFLRVSVDAIARKAAITKRTLYNHFDSKDALAAAVLSDQHARVMVRIREWNFGSDATPEDLIERLFLYLEDWLAKPGFLGSGFTRLTMELAGLPGHPARTAASIHKSCLESWLTDELEKRGASDAATLSRETHLLIEGCLSLVLIHGDPGYVITAREAALKLARTNGSDRVPGRQAIIGNGRKELGGT